MPGLHIPPDTLAQASLWWRGCRAAQGLPPLHSTVWRLGAALGIGASEKVPLAEPSLLPPRLQAAHYDYEEKEAAVSACSGNMCCPLCLGSGWAADPVKRLPCCCLGPSVVTAPLAFLPGARPPSHVHDRRPWMRRRLLAWRRRRRGRRWAACAPQVGSPVGWLHGGGGPGLQAASPTFHPIQFHPIQLVNFQTPTHAPCAAILACHRRGHGGDCCLGRGARGGGQGDR